MKIVVISDTHGQHESLGTLVGDVLIHCGDFCYGDRSAKHDIESLDLWFGRQNFGLILCTGGNHDFLVEELQSRGQQPFRNARYLQDELVSYGGLSFWGAPWIPELSSWAHYRDDQAIRSHWTMIPEATDVLITHTPPFGLLDRNSQGRQCGCPRLLHRLDAVRPAIHCFGHIHASAGVLDAGGTKYVNASVVGRNYKAVRGPITLTL